MRRVTFLWGLAALTASSLTGAVSTAQAATTPTASTAHWEQWLHLPGVFDLGGPRSDGRIVAAAHAALALVGTGGGTTSFAPSYAAQDGSESYITVSPGLDVDGASCSFARDEVLALDLRSAQPGITRIAVDGTVSRLATVAGVSSLNGITLDTVGTFGHRLLVVGAAGPGTTAVIAVDCTGKMTTVGTVSTALEGGIAVAPLGFTTFGGDLVAPNENDGAVYTVSPNGRLTRVVASGVPAGADIGVESVGFMPLQGAATAYVADRGTANNPHPGTDSVLRLVAPQLTGAGVAGGDMLVATEGGDTLVDVRCAQSCTSTVVATGPPTAHGEGRLLIVPAAADAGASASPGGTASAPAAPVDTHGATVIVIATAIVIAAAMLAVALVGLRRRTQRRDAGEPDSR